MYTQDLPNLATNGHKIDLKELHVLTNPENLKLINPQNIDFEHMSIGEAGMLHNICGCDYVFHNKQLDVHFQGKCIWSSDPTVEVELTDNVKDMGDAQHQRID